MPEFEDETFNRDWPLELQAMHRAGGAAWVVYAELEQALDAVKKDTGSDIEDLGPLAMLLGCAYRQLEAVRFEGASLLAAWESEQQLVKQEAELVTGHEGR